MPPGDRARTVLVRDADDSVMTRRLLDIVDDIDRGVIVVRPIPGESDRETFALSVLYALGKHVDQKAAFSLRGLCWWFAETWLAGHRITTAVVDRAHTLSRGLLEDLIAMARRAGTDVWLLDASPRSTAAMTRLADEVLDMPEYLSKLAALEPKSATRGHEPDRLQILDIHLPDTGFLSFRADCARQLSADVFTQVDAAWRETFDAMFGWKERGYRVLREAHPGVDDIGLPHLASKLSVDLADLIFSAHNQSTALLRIRATQAALFHDGLVLHHEPAAATVMARELHYPVNGTALQLLSRAVSPSLAFWALDYMINPIMSVPLRYRPAEMFPGTDPEGLFLTTQYGQISVPPGARPILRAHLYDWTRRPDDFPQNSGREARRRDYERGEKIHLLAPFPQRSRAGVDIRRHRSYLPALGSEWMRQRGLTLSRIEDLAPRRPMTAGTADA